MLCDYALNVLGWAVVIVFFAILKASYKWCLISLSCRITAFIDISILVCDVKTTLKSRSAATPLFTSLQGSVLWVNVHEETKYAHMYLFYSLVRDSSCGAAVASRNSLLSDRPAQWQNFDVAMTPTGPTTALLITHCGQRSSLTSPVLMLPPKPLISAYRRAVIAFHVRTGSLVVRYDGPLVWGCRLYGILEKQLASWAPMVAIQICVQAATW